MAQLNTPGTRFSKTGITRCSNKHDCLLGGYFHVECCYNADKKFDMKKKARDRWFCLGCKAHSNVNEPQEKSPMTNPEVSVPEEVPGTSSPVMELTVEEPDLEKRPSRQFEPSDEVMNPPLKRLKLEESPDIVVEPAP